MNWEETKGMIKCAFGYHSNDRQEVDNTSFGSGLESTTTKYSCKYCDYEEYFSTISLPPIRFVVKDEGENETERTETT